MITSEQNPRVKYIRRLLADRRFRQKEQAFVVETDRWLAELARYDCRPRFILHSAAWAAVPANAALLARWQVPAACVHDRLLRLVSELESPVGILAAVPIKAKPLPPGASLLLILDGVSDPGNMGAILRTAAAAGVEGVLLGPGCVDVYNPKVVRAAMGAHLRLPLLPASWPEIAAATAGLHLWLADSGGGRPYSGVDWRQPSALIIGSEGHGPGHQARALAQERLTIPMQAETESLNAAVAAGIILFEARRQRTG